MTNAGCWGHQNPQIPLQVALKAATRLSGSAVYERHVRTGVIDVLGNQQIWGFPSSHGGTPKSSKSLDHLSDETYGFLAPI